MEKRILLIGAAGGIGQIAAMKLVDKGYHVVGTVRDAEEAASVRSAVPGIADVAIVSLSDADAAKESFRAILAADDRPLAAVVGCAGVATYGAVETTPLADFRAFMEVNTFANVALYQAALPYLRQSKGRVVIVSSFMGMLGFPLFSQYSASKHALEGLMNIARLEAGQWGVGVSLIVPGGVKTGMTGDLPAKIAACLGRLSPAEAKLYRAYFEQYSQLMQASVDSYSEPDSVAEKIVTAVEAAQPEPHYVVGDDASGILEQKKTLPERDFDAMLKSMFPGSAVTTA